MKRKSRGRMQHPVTYSIALRSGYRRLKKFQSCCLCGYDDNPRGRYMQYHVAVCRGVFSYGYSCAVRCGVEYQHAEPPRGKLRNELVAELLAERVQYPVGPGRSFAECA